MRLLPENTQCMIVDLQEKLLPAMFNRRDCEERALMMINGLRELEIPMVISQQYTKGLGMSVPAVFEAAGTDKYYDKSTFSCAKDEGILGALTENKEKGYKNVIVCGTGGTCLCASDLHRPQGAGLPACACDGCHRFPQKIRFEDGTQARHAGGNPPHDGRGTPL